MKLLTLLFFQFLLAFSFAQEDRIKFSHLSVEEGLSQSSAFAIAQDSSGYIWIGTYDGLNRYSGYDIQTFRRNSNDEQSLSDNYIQALSVDFNGDLWIGTNSQGVCVYNSTFEEFTRIPFESDINNSGLKGKSVFTIDVLNQNTVVALTDEAINLIDTDTKECTTISSADYYKLKDAPTLTSYFNKTTFSIPEGVEITANSFLLDSKGNQWVATDNGLLRLIENSKFKTYYRELFDPNSLNSNEITCIMEDRGGVIWVGTSLGGVSKWDRLNQGILLYRNNPVITTSLSNNMVRSFYEDKNGNVWVGTVAGGLNYWDRENDEFKHWEMGDGSGIGSNHIREVIEWQGNYLIATDGAGLQLFDPKSKDLRFKNFPIQGMSQNAKVWDIHVVNDELWIATNDQGLFRLKNDKARHFKDEIPTKKTTWVTSDEQGIVWVSTFGNGLYSYDGEKFNNWNTTNSELSDDRIYSVIYDNNALWLGTKGGVNHLDITSQKFTTYSVIDGLPNETVMGIIPDDNGGIWITTNRGICHLMLSEDKVVNYDISNGLQNNEFLVHSFLKLSTGEMLFGGINGFNLISEKNLSVNHYAPPVVLTQFSVAAGDWSSDTSIQNKKRIELEHYQNEFAFEFAALGYADAKNNTYSHFMQGFDKDWKEFDKRRFAQYTNLPPGSYVFKVKAANNDGIINETITSIRIIIHPAFWQTLWFKTGIAICVIGLLLLIYVLRMRQMKKRNQLLEQEVSERTSEVVAQKQEIQNKNHMIQEALHDIQDSIMYAKRIQHAILPPTNMVQEYLKDSFVLYLPKDIVAGDFYWMQKHKDKILFAAADCTGHGVPGAMVSVVCNNALNRSVREYGLHKPGEILDKVREIVINEFEKSEEEVKDGMDIALCSLTFENDGSATLEYAGAHNPLWIISNGDIIEIKADKQPIGRFIKPTPFTTHELKLQKGDVIYLFSDGYADQFGGERGKKFKTKAFKKLLIEISDKPMGEQKTIIHNQFQNWMGELEQLDDVCVIGVRVS